MNHRYFRAIEVFAEAATVDTYLWYKLISNEVRAGQIVTASFGFNVFRK
jgi:hypothetical protein